MGPKTCSSLKSIQVNTLLVWATEAVPAPHHRKLVGVSQEELFSRGEKKSFFLTLEHKCVKHIHLKLIWFKLKALLCNELRNPTSSIKIKPSQAAMCTYLSIFICHGLFTGIKSKTMETHRRENIQKCVHGPWQGHSCNMDFSKHRLYKRRSQILSSFITHAFSAVVCRSWNAVWGLWFPSEIIWLVCFLKINVPYGTSLGSNWKTAEDLFEPTQPWNRPVLFQTQS